MQRMTGQIPVNLMAVPMGGDLCVIITGGDLPHLGAVTVGAVDLEPETVSFNTHKERHITAMAAGMLRERFDRHFAVLCGIHVDKIKKEEIDDIMALTKEMIEELIVRIVEWT